jgi:hypothetical protein
MTRALIAEFKRLAAPLECEEEYGGWVWFRGTVEQAAQCPLLQRIGVPGEGDRPKSFFVTHEGRRINLVRHTKRLVRLRVNYTKAEEQAERDAVRQQESDREALKKAAELDAKAKAALQNLAEQPTTEEDFRRLARETFWREWSVFKLMYLGSHRQHKSGFRFSGATIDVLDGLVHNILWSLDADGDVIFDEEERTAKVRALQAEACKLDAPLQRFLAQAKVGPVRIDKHSGGDDA